MACGSPRAGVRRTPALTRHSCRTRSNAGIAFNFSIVNGNEPETENCSRNMNNPNRKTKLALLINMISPARISLYSALANAFDLLILHGGNERNRDSWRGFEKDLRNAKVKRAWGWQIVYSRKHAKQTFDEQYLHINPGYAWELVRFAPDIVITCEMGVRTVLALLYGAIFARPVWVWWGGTLHTERNKAGRLKRILRALLARWVRRWISYGKSSTQYLLSLGIPRERILELQNTA